MRNYSVGTGSEVVDLHGRYVVSPGEPLLAGGGRYIHQPPEPVLAGLGQADSGPGVATMATVGVGVVLAAVALNIGLQVLTAYWGAKLALRYHGRKAA